MSNSDGVVCITGSVCTDETVERLIGVAGTLLRRRAITNIIVGVTFICLIGMCCRRQPIKRVITVAVSSRRVDNLSDIVDGVELILKVGDSRRAFGMSQPR